jgi:TorA maturation chaperone TorD
MDNELSLAERFFAVGRMLHVQPTTEVVDAFLGLYPEFGPVDMDELQQDYLRLFVGLGTPLAPPWESAWASDARLLFQCETLDVRYWYRSAGLEVADLHAQPDDHIGLELEFMGRLLERGDAEAVERFATEHPCAWVSRWCDAVQDNAATPFYRQLAAEAHSLICAGAER